MTSQLSRISLMLLCIANIFSRASYKLSFAKRRCSYRRWIKGARHFVKEVPNSISPVEENGELKMIKCFPFSIQVFLWSEIIFQ